MIDEKLIYEMSAKVDILWSGMKVVYLLIGTQIVATIIGIVKNGNGRSLRKEDYVLLKEIKKNGSKQ